MTENRHPIGSRVRFIMDGEHVPYGLVGTVVDKSLGAVLVDFDNWTEGHCEGGSPGTGIPGTGSRWWVGDEEIEPAIFRADEELTPAGRETKQALIRTFESGATRDVDHDKLEFEGFLSPLVLHRYAQYMHKKRRMADGSLRDADNWQKGIPLDAYMSSTMRHVMDMWLHHRGLSDLTVEDEIDTLCALLFNVQGYLFERLKAQRASA